LEENAIFEILELKLPQTVSFSFIYTLYLKRVVRTKFDIYFLSLSLGWYLWRWTIRSRGYHPSSSQCFVTDMVYYIYSLL